MSNKAAIPESCIWTSLDRHAFVRSMDDTADDRLKLVRHLLLEAGRVMEDVSPEFALAMRDVSTICARIAMLEQTVSDLLALAGAAHALLRVATQD